MRHVVRSVVITLTYANRLRFPIYCTRHAHAITWHLLGLRGVQIGKGPKKAQVKKFVSWMSNYEQN